MADASKTVEIVFFGKDEISKTIKGIEGSFDSLKNLADPFADLAKSVLAVEVAVAGLGLAAATVAADFDKSFKNLSATLDVSEDDAKELEKTYKDVFKTGIVDSVDEAQKAVSEAFKRFGKDADLEGIVLAGKQIEQTFGADISESFNAAQTLVKNFGVTAEEAFDLITAGYQKGLDNSGDFLESINEYSTQFSNGGADAKQFFSIMETGYQGGVLGTDKAADAFKEFRVKIQDGSKATTEALELIGIDAGKMATDMANGSVTAVDAFNTVIDKLNNTKDSSKVLQAGVGLLGTQFEDLGTDAALALSTTSESFTNVEGSADNLVKNFDGVGKSVKSLVNTLKVEISELDIWDDLFKSAQENIEKIRDIIPDVLAQIDFSELLESFKDLGASISGLFGDVDITDADDLKNIIQDVVDSIESLQDLTTGIITGITPFFEALGAGVKYFNDLDEGTKQLIGTIGGVSIGFTAAYAAIAPLVAAFTGSAGLVVAAGAAGAALGTFLNKLDSIQTSAQFVIESLDKVFGFTGAKTSEELKRIDANFAIAKKQAEATLGTLKEINEQPVKPDVKWADIVEAGKSTKELADELQRAADHQSITTKVSADTKEAKQELESFFYEVSGKQYEMKVPITADTKLAEKSIKDLTEKGELTKFKIEADLDKTKVEEETERIKIAAEKVQESFKYQAEVNVAKAEAAAEIMKSTFESVGETISSTTDLVGDLVGSLEGADYSTRQEIKSQLDAAEERADKAFELQEKLVNAQIENLDAMTKLAETGEITIKVDGTEFDPEIQMMWEKVFRFMQAKLNAVGFASLFGVPA